MIHSPIAAFLQRRPRVTQWLVAFGAAWTLAAPGRAAEIQALEVGLVPNLTARTLLTAFEPMRAYLERNLKQPVRLSTAPNFGDFYARTQKGEFDLVVTPPHFAWLACHDAHYTPIFTYTEPLRGLLVVARDNPMRTVSELRGKKLGIVDPLAIVTMRGLQWLREQGLQAGTDFSVQAVAPHSAAALAVAQGEFDAAIIGSGPYYIMPAEIRAHIRVFSEVGEMPNAVYLTSSRVSAERRRELQAQLLGFFNESEAGRKFMEQYRYGAGKAISAPELKAMEVYARQAKQLLEAGP